MARVPLVQEADMTPQQRRVLDAMRHGRRKSAPVGPLAIAMHRPELAEAWSGLGLVLRFDSTFAPRLREFTILLTGRYWDCQFEWADEQLIHDYAMELLDTHFVGEALYNRVRDMFGVSGVVELTALIGYYAMVALTLNAHEFGAPDGVAPPLPSRAG
jgi:4-carboxymuconolactone decarboxylase